jgi:hypothetical protein
MRLATVISSAMVWLLILGFALVGGWPVSVALVLIWAVAMAITFAPRLRRGESAAAAHTATTGHDSRAASPADRRNSRAVPASSTTKVLNHDMPDTGAPANGDADVRDHIRVDRTHQASPR